MAKVEVKIVKGLAAAAGTKRLASTGGQPPAVAPAPRVAYLDVQTVAVELGGVEVLGTNPELAVQRLISRGRLGAVRLGAGGPLRVAVSEVERYVAAGCPDVKMPKVSGTWFDHQTTWAIAEKFSSDIRSALADQIPPDDQPPAVKVDALGSAQTVQLQVTAAVRSVIIAPVTDAMWPADTKKAMDRFLDRRHLYLVNRLRSAVQDALDGSFSVKGGPLADLYSGPERYNQAVNAGLEKVRSGGFYITRYYNFATPQYRGQITVTFVLPHSVLMHQSVMPAVLDVAF